MSFECEEHAFKNKAEVVLLSYKKVGIMAVLASQSKMQENQSIPQSQLTILLCVVYASMLFILIHKFVTQNLAGLLLDQCIH